MDEAGGMSLPVAEKRKLALWEQHELPTPQM